MSNPRIIEETDKYDGTKESKERLCFLFMVTHSNMKNFVNDTKIYVKYITQHLNEKLKEFGTNTYKIKPYYNNLFKLQEAPNVFELSVKLFNVLTSFYSLKQYVSYTDKNIKQKFKKQIQELKEFNNLLNSKLQAEILESESNISINCFLRDCRNIVVHKGKIICQFTLLDNNEKTKYVPALIIPVASIWNDNQLKKYHLTKEHCLDTLEVFEEILSCFNKLKLILDDIVSN